MLHYLTLIFCCQLLGEVLVKSTGLPIPGPVVGMAILFAGLLARDAVPDDLSCTADGLIRNMSLLFVPAGVGVMLHAKMIGRDWLPISLSLVLSTALTIVVTAKLLVLLSPATGEAKEDG
ncbi:MAG: CidA/LrgA family protein [Fuerstiella sp.]